VIGRNISALVAAQVATKVLNLLVSVALVRWLGVHELGRYAYVLAFCFPFGALADFGLATLAIRDASRAPAAAPRMIAVVRRVAASCAAANRVATRHADAARVMGCGDTGCRYTVSPSCSHGSACGIAYDAGRPSTHCAASAPRTRTSAARPAWPADMPLSVSRSPRHGGWSRTRSSPPLPPVQSFPRPKLNTLIGPRLPNKRPRHSA